MNVKNLLQNGNVKKGLDVVTGVVKTGCAIVVPILASVAFTESKRYVLDKVCYSGNLGYENVVNAILKSSMYSSDKQKMVALVKRGEDASYYKTIMTTVESSMYSGDKIAMIKTINGEPELEES